MGLMTTDIGADEGDRPLRADAARNRELILRTAADVFAEQGLDAGYDEIARRAGIGVGTVYRRFPERAELVQALFESRIGEIIALAEKAAENPDAFDGLAWFLERALAHQVADRGLKEVMSSTISADDHRAMGSERLGPVVEALLTRAQDEGAIRSDVAASDLGMQSMLISSMTTASQPDLWRRYLALLLDGMRARPDLEPLPLSAPPEAAMHEFKCNVYGGR